jgi:pilus assembly protein CpaD
MSKSPLLNRVGLRLLAATALTLTVAGCKHLEGAEQVYGYALVDPAQRHPIMVTQAPTELDLEVVRGRPGLAPEQRAAVIDFLRRYKRESTTGKLVVAVPSGAPNEVAAVNATGIVKGLARAEGIGWHEIKVEPYSPEEGNPAPALKVSFVRHSAEAPDCGRFPDNLAETRRNLPYHNLGCATQRNLAAMVDNPQDLLTPRTMVTPRMSERRDTIHDKWVKGESTTAKKEGDEKVKVKNSEQ